jgi:hypothetical protein
MAISCGNGVVLQALASQKYRGTWLFIDGWMWLFSIDSWLKVNQLIVD